MDAARRDFMAGGSAAVAALAAGGSADRSAAQEPPRANEPYRAGSGSRRLDIVTLRDLEEMEYREIAQVLNVPEGTVKSRLSRGRAELARILRKQNAGMKLGFAV